MREKRDAKFAEHGALDNTAHVGPARDLARGNMNLIAEATGVSDCGAIDDAIETRPERVGHAHRARLAGGVHGEAGERRTLELFAREANCADLGMRGGIVFAHHGVGGSHKELAGARLDNESTEGHGARRVQSAGSEAIESAHARLVTEGADRTSRFGTRHAGF